MPCSTISFALMYSELLRFCVPTCTTLPDFFRRLHHLSALLDGVRQGFFAVDVFAGLDRRHEHLVVQMFGRGNEDGVDGRVLKQFAVIGVGLGQLPPMVWTRSFARVR